LILRLFSVSRSLDVLSVRPKRHPSYCFRRAGSEFAGRTQGGKFALQITAQGMPAAIAPLPNRNTDRAA
jgi:hypothetical protein